MFDEVQTLKIKALVDAINTMIAEVEGKSEKLNNLNVLIGMLNDVVSAN